MSCDRKQGPEGPPSPYAPGSCIPLQTKQGGQLLAVGRATVTTRGPKCAAALEAEARPVRTWIWTRGAGRAGHRGVALGALGRLCPLQVGGAGPLATSAQLCRRSLWSSCKAPCRQLREYPLPVAQGEGPLTAGAFLCKF